MLQAYRVVLLGAFFWSRDDFEKLHFLAGQCVFCCIAGAMNSSCAVVPEYLIAMRVMVMTLLFQL